MSTGPPGDQWHIIVMAECTAESPAQQFQFDAKGRLRNREKPAPVSESSQADPCQDGSRNFIYKNRIERNCNWIGKNYKRIDKRCKDPVAADNCPVTCSICA